MFMTCEIVCKLRLENEPRDYGSNDIEQILQSLTKRKPKWHMQFYPIECVSETESEVSFQIAG